MAGVQLPNGRWLFTYNDFSGGKNSAFASAMLADNQLEDIINGDLVETGAIQKRKGYARVIPRSLGAGGMQGLYEYRTTSNGRYLLGVWNEQLYASQNLTSWTGPIFTLSEHPVTFSSYRGKAYMLDGGNSITVLNILSAAKITPYTTSGEESNNLLADEGNPIHKCKYHLWKNDWMIMAGSSAAPNLLYISALEDPSYFPANRIIRIGDDTDAITGLALFYDAIVIFKRRSTWVLHMETPSDLSTMKLVRIHDNIGCVDHRTIRLAENMLVFLSEQGVYAVLPANLFKEQLQFKHLSANVQRDLRDTTNASAIYDNHVYRLCLPEQGIVFKYYVRLGAWSVDTHPLVNEYIIFDNEVICGHYSEGLVYKLGVGHNDDGAPFTFRVVTKPYDFGNQLLPKKLKRGFVVFRRTESQCVVQASIKWNREHGLADFVETTFDEDFAINPNEQAELGDFILGTHRLGEFPTVVTRAVPLSGRGNVVQVAITNSDEGDVTLYGVGVSLKIKKPR